MFDFNKYDDAIDVKGYDGFIDKLGNFYKVCKKNKKANSDSHNVWAEKYIREKLKITDLKVNNTVSMLLGLSKLSGPAEVLINCFGYVYYSHDPFFHGPIIKIPNPKIAGYKVTEEQLDMLSMVMILNNEDTNIPIFFDDNEEYTYCDLDGPKHRK